MVSTQELANKISPIQIYPVYVSEYTKEMYDNIRSAILDGNKFFVWAVSRKESIALAYGVLNTPLIVEYVDDNFFVFKVEMNGEFYTLTFTKGLDAPKKEKYSGAA